MGMPGCAVMGFRLPGGLARPWPSHMTWLSRSLAQVGAVVKADFRGTFLAFLSVPDWDELQDHPPGAGPLFPTRGLETNRLQTYDTD